MHKDNQLLFKYRIKNYKIYLFGKHKLLKSRKNQLEAKRYGEKEIGQEWRKRNNGNGRRNQPSYADLMYP